MEHDTGHTIQHGQRYEYRYKHKGGSDNGYPHLIGCVDSRLVRVFAALHVPRYILQHHDRIIHHHTDGYRQRTERDDIKTRIGYCQINERDNQRNRNRDTDDDGCTPAAQEEEHDEDDEDECVQHRLFQRIDRVLNRLRQVVDLLDLNIRRELFLNAVQLFAHIAADLYRVGTRLLGDDEADSLTTVRLLVQRQILDRILDGRNVTNEHLLTLRGHRYHQILDLARLDILGTHLHLVLFLRHLDRTGGEVKVVRRNDVSYLLQCQTVRVQFLLVDVNIHIAVRGTGKRDVSDSVHLVELRNDLIVEDLVQARIGLIGRNGVLRNRHCGSGQFEDHRRTAVIRQVGFGHIHIRPHIVHRLVHVSTPLQLQHYHGHVILGLRSDMLEVINRGQSILHDLGHIGLHLGSRRTRIGRHDRDIRRVHLREHIHRQFHEAINTDDDDCHKEKGGRYRFFYR